MKLISIFLIFLVSSAAFAQNVRQLSGTGGSVAGSVSAGNFRTHVVAGQPVVGRATGGEFANGSGWAEIWSVPGVILDVPQAPEFLPIEFELKQNYPNPFNPSTTFEFALPKHSRVRLVLYDVLGRESVRILDADYSAGRYIHHFTSPSGMASGIYFAAFDSGEYHAVRKVILLK